MKLGLCICYYNYNYGSMLQAYATVKEIESREIDYTIIGYKKNWKFFVKNVSKVLNTTWRSEKKLRIQKKFSSLIRPQYGENCRIRNEYFRQFQIQKFDDKVCCSQGYEALVSDARKYDAVLVGSDQMWSPSGLSTNFYNLMFVPDDIKKVSYASSFGVSEIPKAQKAKTAKYLERINYLSVRENRAKEIIEELTGKEALVAVDPTMLLSMKEWDNFSGEVPVISEPYIFAYFLGANQEHREKVNELKNRTGLKVVTLKHLDQYIPDDESFGDYAPYNVGPEQFVNLIKNAEYVCTDSFHGTVFSTIFHKKFLTFSRYNNTSNTSKNSRIESLLENLGIEDRLSKNEDIISQITKEIDYNELELKRNELISISKKFLDKALGEQK